MNRLLLCIILVLTCSSWSWSQQNVPFDKEHFPNDKDGLKEAIKAIKEGDRYYNFGARLHNLCIDHFLKAHKFNPDNAELNMKIGHCYLSSPQKVNAIAYLEKANKLDPDLDAKVNYFLGRAYHLNTEWDKAIVEYESYRVLLNYKDKDKITDVKKKIQECKNGKELMRDTVKVKIENIGQEINSKFPEYGPVISTDESVLIFTSRRDNTTGGGKDLSLNVYFEDIYIARENDGAFDFATNIGKPVNTEKHDATIALSSDGQKLFVYKDDMGDGNIYECRLKGDKWTEPEKLGEHINSRYHESSISFSYDGKIAYFVSGREEDNLGGRDIFVSSLGEDGEWGPARNIGPTINTQYGEEGVFMHPDGRTMYFSSQGHNTMGGYDIFRTVYDYETRKWSEPENLGYPINTPDDDVFFVISGSGKHAYYASVQPDGYGEKDIYRITFLEPEKMAAPMLTVLKGVITGEETGKPLEASIEIVDNEKNEVIATFESNSTTGKYLVSLPSGKNYGIAVKSQGYLFHSENFDIPKSTGYHEVEKNIELKKIAVGGKIILNNIFFDYDKATLRPESATELERLTQLMKDMPSLKIEISGHTDNKGSAAYNTPLSEKRAKSVVQYLIDHGVDAGRLSYKGYGFKQPIASNDTEEGRQMNRRTEFKILSK